MKKALLEVIKNEPYKTKVFILDSMIFFTKDCDTRAACREIKAQIYEEFHATIPEPEAKVYEAKAFDYSTGFLLE